MPLSTGSGLLLFLETHHKLLSSMKLTLWLKTGQVLRSACNRCHAQKLSCQRKDGGPCARCVKANTTCASSASQRNRRGRSLAKQPSRVVKDSMLQSKLDVRERQPRAPSTPSTKISGDCLVEQEAPRA